MVFEIATLRDNAPLVIKLRLLKGPACIELLIRRFIAMLPGRLPRPLLAKGSHLTPIRPRFKMDWNRVEGNWKQVKGKVNEKWGNLTDDDLTAINGQRDQLEGKIQERYGLAKDKVRKDVDDWYNTQTW